MTKTIAERAREVLHGYSFYGDHKLVGTQFTPPLELGIAAALRELREECAQACNGLVVRGSAALGNDSAAVEAIDKYRSAIRQVGEPAKAEQVLYQDESLIASVRERLKEPPPKCWDFNHDEAEAAIRMIDKGKAHANREWERAVKAERRAEEAERRISETRNLRNEIILDLQTRLAAAESRTTLDASPEEIAAEVNDYFVKSQYMSPGGKNVFEVTRDAIKKHLRPHRSLANHKPDEKIRPWVQP